MSIVSLATAECRVPRTPPDVLSETGQLCWMLGWFSASDWLEDQDHDGSEDFGRGFAYAIALLRGE